MNLHTYGLLYLHERLGVDRFRFQGVYGKQLDATIRNMGWRVDGRMSDLEKWTAVAFAAYGFTPPIVKQELTVGRFRLDFAIPGIQLAVEVDGPHHNFPDLIDRDIRKSAFLQGEGWSVRRIDCKSGHVEPSSIGAQVGTICAEVFSLLEGDYQDLTKTIDAQQLRFDATAALQQNFLNRTAAP